MKLDYLRVKLSSLELLLDPKIEEEDLEAKGHDVDYLTSADFDEMLSKKIAGQFQVLLDYTARLNMSLEVHY